MEVLLSVVILSVGLTLIIQSLTAALRTTVYGRDYTQAVILLESKIFDLQQAEFVDETVEQTGHFDPPFNKYQYRIEIKNLAEGSFKGLNEVQVVVQWPSGVKEKQISAVTYFFDKPESEG